MSSAPAVRGRDALSKSKASIRCKRSLAGIVEDRVVPVLFVTSSHCSQIQT